MARYFTLIAMLLLAPMHLRAQGTGHASPQVLPNSFWELTVSPLFVGAGYHKPLSNKHIIGAELKTGLFLPILYNSLSFDYRYYPGGYTLYSPQGWTIKPLLRAGVSGTWAILPIKEVGVGPYLGVGVDFGKNKFFIRPSLMVGYPITLNKKNEPAPTVKDILIYSGVMSIGLTTIGFRF